MKCPMCGSENCCGLACPAMATSESLDEIIERAKSKTPCASNYQCLLADLLGYRAAPAATPPRATITLEQQRIVAAIVKGNAESLSDLQKSSPAAPVKATESETPCNCAWHGHSKKIKVCAMCETPMGHATGIGYFCPNSYCKNVDGPFKEVVVASEASNEPFDAIKWLRKEFPNSIPQLEKEEHPCFTSLLDDYVKIATAAFAAGRATSIRKAVQVTLEEAAKVCDAQEQIFARHRAPTLAEECRQIAKAIRSLDPVEIEKKVEERQP